MKNIIISCLVFISTFSNAQFALHDATIINDHIINSKFKEAADKLFEYYISYEKYIEHKDKLYNFIPPEVDDQLIKLFDIKKDELIRDPNKAVDIMNMEINKAIVDLSKRDYSISNSFFVGFTDFIIERANQEMVLHFMERLKKQLDERKPLGENFKILFPQTFNFITQKFQPIYFQRDLSMIKEVLKVDLMSFTINFPEIIKSNWFIGLSRDNPDIKFLGEIFVGLCNIMEDKDKEVVQKLNTFFLNAVKVPTNSNFGALFKCLGYLSLSVSDKNNNMWLDDISKLKTNKDIRKLYLGLLLSKLESIKFNTKINENNINHKNIKSKLGSEYKEFIRPIDKRYLEVEYNINKATILFNISKIDNIEKVLESIEKKWLRWDKIMNINFNGVENDKLKQQINFIGELFNEVTELIRCSNIKGVEIIEDRIIPVKDLVTNSLLMYINFREKKYDIGITNLGVCLAAAGFNFIPIEKLLKYSNFIIQVCSAKTSEDAKNVIQAYALPLGSSALKKNNSFSIGIQSYFGFAGGYESVIYKDSKDSVKMNLAYNLPLGVDFSWGFRTHDSFTLFATLFNLGALADYRINDRSLDDTPGYKFGNFISPGIQLIYGFKKFPVSIGFGIEYKNNYRVNEIMNKYSVIQYKLSLGIDIPIVSIYSSERKLN